MIANPPPWPNGARCAAAITFDIDVDSMAHYRYPARAARDMAYLSWSRYDQVAIPRILRIYKRQGIKQTFFMPAWVMENYPWMVEQIADGGHEIALHGYIHEEPQAFSPEEERYWVERSVEIFQRLAGVKPSGWRAPLYQFSDTSAGILAENGFLYDSSLMGDDVPYLLRSAAGDVLELPVEWIMDDWLQYAYVPSLGFEGQPRTPDNAMAAFQAELEAAREWGGLWITVWHPMVSGRVSRAMRVERLIEQVHAWGDVWLAPLGTIARHVQRCIAEGSWNPRVDDVPYYTGPVPGISEETPH